MYCGSCHVEPFGDSHDGISFETVFCCHPSATWRSPPSADYLSNLFWVGYNIMPPHCSHPQIPLSTQTSTPNFDPFFSPLFMFVTFEQMTIKHSMYMQKVCFLCTERACVVFPSFGICPRRKISCNVIA